MTHVTNNVIITITQLQFNYFRINLHTYINFKKNKTDPFFFSHHSQVGMCLALCLKVIRSFLVESGDTKPLSYLKLKDKEDLIQTMLFYLCILKSKPELDQLKEGLQFLSVGLFMSRQKDIMKPPFLVAEVSLTAGNHVHAQNIIMIMPNIFIIIVLCVLKFIVDVS